MPCALGRATSSRQFAQRGGSLLTKRYFDPKTHKLYPPLLRNTEERCVYFTMVTFELDSWRFVAPVFHSANLRNRLGSEVHAEGVLESLSPPLGTADQDDLPSGKNNPSDTRGSAISASYSGVNVQGKSRNRKKATKSLVNSCSTVSNNFSLSECDVPVLGSDILVSSIAEAVKPVDNSRKKRKKKGKKNNKSMLKTHGPVLETLSEESISDSSVCGTAISTDTASTIELSLENNVSENLSIHDITTDQNESQICVNRPTTSFSDTNARDDGSCNILDNMPRYDDTDSSIKNVGGDYSPKSGIIFHNDTSCCSSAETTCDKDSVACTTCCSINHIWPRDVIDTDHNTERSENSRHASSSDDFQPVINRKRNRVSKQMHQNLNGIHRFGSQNVHGLMGKERDYSHSQRVQKYTTKDYIGEPKRLSHVSRHVDISSKTYEVKERLDTSLGFKQYGRGSAGHAQTSMIEVSLNDRDSNKIPNNDIPRQCNVSENPSRRQNPCPKQGNHNFLKTCHADYANLSSSSNACDQQKVVGVSPHLTQQQSTSSGSTFESNLEMPTNVPVPCQTRDVEDDTLFEGTCSTSSDAAEKPIIPSVLTPIILNHKNINDHCDSNKDMHEAICPTDNEDHENMKIEREKSAADSIQVFQKLLPIEKNDSVGHTGRLTSDLNEPVLSITISKEEQELLTCNHCEDPAVLATSKGSLVHEAKDQCFSVSQTDLGKIVQAVGESYRLQAASEGFSLVTGSPIAEFEKFVFSATPVVDQISCRSCSPNQLAGSTFCAHYVPNIPLTSLWQWYERHGTYGMEVKVEDYYNYKKSQSFRDRPFEFRAYFVPYLSAIQLFGWCKSSTCSNNSHSSKKVLRDCVSDEGTNQSSRSTHLEDGELLFEYFESDLPQLRRPLFEKIKELIKGGSSPNTKQFGDPLKLQCLNLHDLHPASWYSVAWYPIYRIPDGSFRATFLSYHSLGNFPRTTCRRPGSSAHLVSPVVGLQTYNAKGECWFRPRGYKTTEYPTEIFLPSGSSEIMEMRLGTLEQTALVMATAKVRKGNARFVNRHPDYEFMSRRW